MPLETLSPAADWERGAHADAVEALATLDEAVRLLLWCDDGCVDCQAQLPAFAATLDAAGIDDDRLLVYPVDRLPEGRKRGPRVDEYGVTRIPTVVIERDGQVLARYEEGPPPIAEALAGELAAVGTGDG